MSAMTRSLVCWPPQMAQWIAESSLGGVGNVAAASATVGIMISCHGCAAFANNGTSPSDAHAINVFIAFLLSEMTTATALYKRDASKLYLPKSDIGVRMSPSHEGNRLDSNPTIDRLIPN